MNPSLVAVTLLVAAAFSLPAVGAPRPAQRPVIVKIEKGGLRWGDVALGAVGTLGTVLVLAAGWLAYSTARRQRSSSAGPLKAKERSGR